MNRTSNPYKKPSRTKPIINIQNLKKEAHVLEIEF